MNLKELVGKRCVIGLSYFDKAGELLKRSQLCGRVVNTDEDAGISVALLTKSGANYDSELAAQTVAKEDVNKEAVQGGKDASPRPPIFVLPPNLAPWFSAPAGNYRDLEGGVEVKNPDYLVTWDIYRTKALSEDGEHEWWEWFPRTAPPSVGVK